MYISFQKIPNWVRVRIYISFTVLSILARVMLNGEHIYLDHKIRGKYFNSYLIFASIGK